MVAVFFVFRMRFYAAWCGAEAACISAGLGCYPEKSLTKPGGGPTVNYRCSGCCPYGATGEGVLGGHWEMEKWFWGCGVLYRSTACEFGK